MLKSTSSRGRPKAVLYPKTGGDPVVGLMRLGDGRWRASGPEKYTFTEADEKLAIARFLMWEAQKKEKTIRIPVAAAPLRDLKALAKAILAAEGPSARPRFPDGPGSGFLPPDTLDLPPRSALPAPPGLVLSSRSRAASQPAQVVRRQNASEQPIRIELKGDILEFYNSLTQQSAFYPWLRRHILENLQLVAERTGIESLRRLPELPDPEPIPTLAKLEQIWDKHFESSKEQKRKCKQAFEDFLQVTGVQAIEDIKPPVVVTYRDEVYRRRLSGKSQSNSFTRIRRYLSFFRDRAVAMDAMTKALGYLKLLKPDQSTVSLNPRPIEVAEWRKLLKATKGDDKAMILMMLNGAMYLQEVIRLQWQDIQDGCLVTHRAKTGQCIRVAVLWKETLAALKAMPRSGPYIFYNNARAPLGIKGAERRFRALREAAKVSVTSSQLRDGAYTAAVDANVTQDLCQLLVGHRSGIADHYVKRKPTMVAPACEAIHRAYFK